MGGVVVCKNCFQVIYILKERQPCVQMALEHEELAELQDVLEEIFCNFKKLMQMAEEEEQMESSSQQRAGGYSHQLRC